MIINHLFDSNGLNCVLSKLNTQLAVAVVIDGFLVFLLVENIEMQSVN